MKKSPIITGTLLLTAAGFLSRFIGFFYRIFLSRTFGAESIGIYQMAFPLFALSFSLCAAGIQTAISRFAACRKDPLRVLLSGCIISLTLSFICMIYFRRCSDFLSEKIIRESATAALIRIMALSIPLESMHSCINGYYFGVKKAAVPAFTQLVEQLFRVVSVYLFCIRIQSANGQPGIQIAAVGIVIGEASACIASLLTLLISYVIKSKALSNPKAFPYFSSKSVLSVPLFASIIRFAAPLSANRMILNTFASIEAISIPKMLVRHGLNGSLSLSTYGILTGMALPLVLFPNAISNSISVMLLPVISEAQGKGNHSFIRKIIYQCSFLSICIGFCFSAFFFITGHFLANFLYHEPCAGNYIRILGFLCPFLYLSAILSSILHGLGKTGTQFTISLVSLTIRLAFVFLAIPVMGISGYLIGLLLSQLIQALLLFLSLQPSLIHTIIK